MIRPPQTLPASPAVAAAIVAGLDFHMLQQVDELIAFVAWLESVGVDLSTSTVLEIGQHHGGSTAFFATLNARVIAIDLPDGVGGGLPMLQAYQRNTALRTRFPSFVGILADSHEQETYSQVRDLLNDQLVDLLFIDGDHSEYGVTADFAMYRPFVRPGGVIAFHDIAATRDPHCTGVPIFWQVLKASAQTYEFTTPGAAWGGIGAFQCPIPSQP